MARRTTIRTTTETLLIVGNSWGRCPVCGGVMVTLDQGHILCGVALERLNRLLASGAAHYSNLAGVPYLVCLHSLLICLQSNNPA